MNFEIGPEDRGIRLDVFLAGVIPDVTRSQLRVLNILDHDPGMTAGVLAERLAVQPSTVTGLIDRLVKLELVERQGDVDDRRRVRTFLSASDPPRSNLSTAPTSPLPGRTCSERAGLCS